MVPADELGKVFGAVAVCGDLANMAGTLVANSIYTPLRFNKIASIGRRYAPSNEEKFRKMQRNAEKFIDMQRNLEKCREIERNAEKCREMQKNAEKCRETQRNAEKCREM